jgi:hypothetical protein
MQEGRGRQAGRKDGRKEREESKNIKEGDKARKHIKTSRQEGC